MNKCLYIWLLLLTASISLRGQPFIDSLFKELQKPKEDSNKVFVLCLLAEYHEGISLDSNNYYVQKAINLSEKINYSYGKFIALRSTFYARILRANYTEALRIALESLNRLGEIQKETLYTAALAHADLSVANRLVGNQRKSLEEASESYLLQQRSHKIDGNFWNIISNRGNDFLPNQPDSAIYYARKAYELALQPHSRRDWCLAAARVGDVYMKLGKYSLAKEYYTVALRESIAVGSVYIQAREYRDLARIFAKTGPADSSLFYAQLALMICEQYNFGDYGLQTSQIISNFYELKNKPDSALKYLKISLAGHDSILGQGKMQQFQAMLAGAEQKQRETTEAAERFQSRVKIYSIICIAVLFLIISMILFRNNKLQKKAKSQIEHAYRELKSTQSLLIQSEKMASLGELTAGIAHEIQNPLNFVNNFSEVNSELIVEMKKEIEMGNIPGVKGIADTLETNMDKITNHGRRADAIVKSMLQHSLTSTGQKELTDINALSDEYLRLSFQGFRARDKTFNASIKHEYDGTIGKINIIPQDIGRVLLNLYNNGFYALSEKKKQLTALPANLPAGALAKAGALATADGNYEPTISVSTKKIDAKIEIKVKDNGVGISEKLREKIFQPFFTTKPAGQGTGLGLSLSYDIIKAHGGEIKVESIEGVGSEFVIQLPA